MDISELRARLITNEDFYKFRYIVCMDHSNYKNVMAMKPADSKAEILTFMSLLPSSSYSLVPDV